MIHTQRQNDCSRFRICTLRLTTRTLRALPDQPLDLPAAPAPARELERHLELPVLARAPADDLPPARAAGVAQATREHVDLCAHRRPHLHFPVPVPAPAAHCVRAARAGEEAARRQGGHAQCLASGDVALVRLVGSPAPDQAAQAAAAVLLPQRKDWDVLRVFVLCFDEVVSWVKIILVSGFKLKFVFLIDYIFKNIIRLYLLINS